MQYFINSENDIKQLKRNLMIEDKSTTILTSPKEKDVASVSEKKDITEIIKRILNTKNCEEFELNIKETLKFEMNFNETSYLNNFIYMFVKLENNDKTIIIESMDKEIDVNGKVFVFKLSKDKSISIINKEDGRLICKIKEIKKKKKENINGKQFIFYPIDEIEIGGIYSINNFDSNCFNQKEVSLISSNVKKGHMKAYDLAIVEVKLSPKKVLRLITQMKKDAKVMKSVAPDKNIIYLGFLGSVKIDSKVNFGEKLKNIDYAIYGLNNNLFFNRNVFKSLDWNLIEKVDKAINHLNNNVKEILEWIKGKAPEFKKEDKKGKILNKKTERRDSKK